MNLLDSVYQAIVLFDRGDARRIQHLIKVHSLAAFMGRQEELDYSTQLTLELTALVHDIGIHPAEKKYGYCNGALQEAEGPAEAEKLLKACGAPAALLPRICFLVGHHHTYTNMEGLDYQILVEADFLVNMYEDGLSAEARQSIKERIFRTKTGLLLFETMFP